MSVIAESNESAKERSRKRKVAPRTTIRLLKLIESWVKVNIELVNRCYVSAELVGVRLFVVVQEEVYSVPLPNRLSELVIKLSDRGIPVTGSGSPIPEGTAEELAAFVHVEKSLIFRG